MNIVLIGGSSIIDKGRDALFPLLDEVVQARTSHQLLLLAGNGKRGRQIIELCDDLGLPTGVMSYLLDRVSEQNATIIQALLANHGGVHLIKDKFELLPLHLKNGIPIITGMPAYWYWELPNRDDKIPPHQTDTGGFLLADNLSVKTYILVKDVDGIYTADPKTHPEAELISQISVKELMDSKPESLPIERMMLKRLMDAHSLSKVQIINGLVPGNLTRALAGEHVGTYLTR